MYFFREWDEAPGGLRLLDLLRRTMNDEMTEEQSLGRPLGGFERENGALVLRLDVPGVASDKVDVTVHGRTVTVTAERPEETPEGYRPLRRERRTGWKVSRTMTLPAGVNADDVSCRIVDGVLTIRFPTKPDQGPRRIQIGTDSEEVHS
jgi:HSP20 family molecular chaperone IbpA